MSRRTFAGVIIIAALIGLAAWLRHGRAGVRIDVPTDTQATNASVDDTASSRQDSQPEDASGEDSAEALVGTDPFPLPDVLVDPEVIVSKGDRVLTVYSDGEPVKRYRLALGHSPSGHKHREGDNRTPEGTYYVCSKNASSKFHRSLGLSYPNEEDADAGLQHGLISAREHKAILSAIHKMAKPPWNTKLGGEIMIHGGGAYRGDWTQGCIALDDKDAEELFVALPMGVTVTIRP